MMNLPNGGRRSVRFLMIAFVAAQLSSFVARADINYAINTTIASPVDIFENPLQTDTVLGSITTDGTIGVLASGNILSWNLNLIDGLNAANDVDLTNANSGIISAYGSTFGGTLTATETGLFFNYSGSGEFGIQEDNFFLSGQHYFCFSTGGDCLAGETIAPGDVFTDGVDATGLAAPVGIQPLNQATTPEPTYGVMLMGFLGVCFAVKRKFAS
jgi:hypothetical protein